MENIYSYHTFILPFVWKDDSNTAKSFDDFTDIFEKNHYWSCHDPKDENSFNDIDNVFSYYAEYQYFYPQIRSALYGFDEKIVKTYHFAYKKVHEQAHYYIKKAGRTYDLLINSINLKIYNTGIALFVMECENHGNDKDGKPQNTLDDVKNINDYGRRINLPFIPENPDWSICADSLEICIPGMATFKTDFRTYIEKVAASREKKNLIHLNYLCSFIKDLLGFSCENKFSSRISDDLNTVFIHPALDDRMFVACLTTDKDATEKFLLKKDKGEYAFNADESLSKSLYEFVFIDNTDSCCSCTCKEMRHNLLDEHIYKRWLESGSIYGVAAQGLVLLFDGGFTPLIGSFLTIYIRMACLCLAQKASLMLFQKETADISRFIHEKENKISLATVTKLMDLQERFSAFESQICFKEITPQEQGIEMYSMFMDSFFIEKELENVKSQIDGLHDATDTYLDFGFNKIALIFTLWGAILALSGPVVIEKSDWIAPMVGLFLSLIVALVIMFFYRRRR